MSAPPDDADARHWRQVAEERRAAHEALARRPLVRAAVALERRAAPITARATALRRRARAGADRAALAVRAAPSTGRAAAEVAALVAAADARPPLVAPDRRVERVVVAADASSAEVGARLRALDADVAVLVPEGTTLLGGSLERLVGALEGDVALAGPTVVHDARPRSAATPADGRTLAAGLALALHDGVPVVVPLGAGAAVAVPDAAAEPEPAMVDAVLAAGAALDVAAVAAAGGLAPVGQLDAALVELADRLRHQGRTVVHVPAALVLDGRAVASAAALEQPIDPASPSWARTIDRRGASLRRSAGMAIGTAPERLEVAFTIAAPSDKVARRWGDWHLASALAAELARAGHGATVRPVDHADDLAVRAADVHLVVRGLRAVRATPGQHQVLWIISHPLDVGVDELDAASLVLVASTTHAEVLRGRTATPVEVLLQATDHRRFAPVAPVAAHRHDVTIVAKSRERHRPMVAAAVEGGLAPAIYGGGWEAFVDPALVVADHVPNDELPAVYASAGVVLNDHWDDMRAHGFVSNRIFDVLACGAPVISDHLPEIAELLGDAVPTWRSPDELVALVAADLADPDAARERAARGRALVLAHHTFERRAGELLELLDRHGLRRPPA